MRRKPWPSMPVAAARMGVDARGDRGHQDKYQGRGSRCWGRFAAPIEVVVDPRHLAGLG